MVLCGVIGVAISVGLGAGIADAECPFISTVQGKSLATAIFTGTPTTITRLNFSQIVTFTVERLWQGTVGRELTAFQVVSAEDRPFVAGVKYLIFARPRDLSGGLFNLSLPGIGQDERLKIEEDRQELERVDLASIGCLSGPADAVSGQRLIGELGPSHTPE
jgi:hypothetical protein